MLLIRKSDVITYVMLDGSADWDGDKLEMKRNLAIVRNSQQNARKVLQLATYTNIFPLFC